MKRFLLIYSLLAMMAAVPQGAWAQTNLIQNPSFDSWNNTSKSWPNWTATVTHGSEDATNEASYGNNKGTDGKNGAVNGGSAWTDSGQTKSWTITISQALQDDLPVGKYKYSYALLLNRNAIQVEAVLTDGTNSINLGTSFSQNSNYQTYSDVIEITTAGKYTIKFTLSTSAATDKQHYFRLDDVSLIKVDSEALSSLKTSVTTKRDNYNTDGAIYSYIDSQLTAAESASDDEAMTILQAVNALDFSNLSDVKLGTKYYIAAGYGVVLQAETTDDGKLKNQGAVQARYWLNTDDQQWTLTGNSFADGFKIISAKDGVIRHAGNPDTSKDNANVTVQVITNKDNGTTYKLVPSTDGKAWRVLPKDFTTSHGLNVDGGVSGVTKMCYWKDATPLTFFAVEGTEDITTLEDTATPALTTGAQNIKLSRNFAAGWNTICLPFNVRYGQLRDNLGSDVELYEFTNAADGNLTFTRKKLSDYNNKKDNTVVMTAHTPYIVKVSEAKSSAFFAQVNIASTEAGSVTKGNVTFAGTYATKDMNGIYGMTAAGQILQGTSSQSVAPFRAYFTTESGVKLQVRMIDENGITTGIMELTDEELNQVRGTEKCFDLSGRAVNPASLKRGVYVINGRKVAVK